MNAGLQGGRAGAGELGQERDVGGGGAGEQAGEAGIGGDFDGAAEGEEAEVLVEGEGVGVVEGAGVEPEAAGREREGVADGEGEEGGAGAAPDERGSDAEEGDFDFGQGAAVDFEESFTGVVMESEDIDGGVVNDGGELGVGKQETAEPEPGFADGAEEGAVAGKLGLGERLDVEGRGGGRQGRRLAQLEIGDHRRDSAGRDGGVAVGDHTDWTAWMSALM